MDSINIKKLAETLKLSTSTISRAFRDNSDIKAATKEMILAKAKEHTVFMGNETHEGYHDKNFHNQYVQFFAELGIIGFLLIVAMLSINLYNGLYRKDFVHICFAVIMISLFLTESFLARQRGVLFFTAFYCFFNSGLLRQKSPNLQ